MSYITSHPKQQQLSSKTITAAKMAPVNPNRVYEDYDPPSDLVTDEGCDTILIYLPGYRKEQLRVQLTTTRILKISGERQIGGNKWRRFNKEFRVPTNCDTKEITAKFEGGILYIRQPKAGTPAAPGTAEQPADKGKMTADATQQQAPDLPQRQPQQAPDLPQRQPQQAPDLPQRQPQRAPDVPQRPPQRAPDVPQRQPQQAPDYSRRQPQQAPDYSRRQPKQAPDYSPPHPQQAPDLPQRQPQRAPDVPQHQSQQAPDFTRPQPQQAPDFTRPQPQQAPDYSLPQPQQAPGYSLPQPQQAPGYSLPQPQQAPDLPQHQPQQAQPQQLAPAYPQPQPQLQSGGPLPEPHRGPEEKTGRKDSGEDAVRRGKDDEGKDECSFKARPTQVGARRDLYSELRRPDNLKRLIVSVLLVLGIGFYVNYMFKSFIRDSGYDNEL